MELLWVDEAIVEVLKRRGGVMGVDELMEELWRMDRRGLTACSGWEAYEEDGVLKHWCRQAWEILKVMESKGVVEVCGDKVFLRSR